MIFGRVENEKCFLHCPSLNFFWETTPQHIWIQLCACMHKFFIHYKKIPSIVVIKAWTQKISLKNSRTIVFFAINTKIFQTFSFYVFLHAFFPWPIGFNLKLSTWIFHYCSIPICFVLALYAVYITIVPCSMYLLIYC
jgi:hypothetical protein